MADSQFLASPILRPTGCWSPRHPARSESSGDRGTSTIDRIEAFRRGRSSYRSPNDRRPPRGWGRSVLPRIRNLPVDTRPAPRGTRMLASQVVDIDGTLRVGEVADPVAGSTASASSARATARARMRRTRSVCLRLTRRDTVESSPTGLPWTRRIARAITSRHAPSRCGWRW